MAANTQGQSEVTVRFSKAKPSPHRCSNPRTLSGGGRRALPDVTGHEDAMAWGEPRQPGGVHAFFVTSS